MEQPDRRGPHNAVVKAGLVIAGPTLVTLIPMAAAPALPAMAKAFDAAGQGTLFAQMVVTAPAIMVILGAPVAGTLAEFIGRRGCMLASLVLFCLAGVACVLAPDSNTLIAARLTLGLAGGGLLTTSLALASEFPEGGPRERLLGSMVACTAVFAILALNFGGELVDVFGWRGSFALYLLGVPVLLMAWAKLESHAAAPVTHASLFAVLRTFWAVYLVVVILAIGMFMTPVQGMLLVEANGVGRAVVQSSFISCYSAAAALSAASFCWLARRFGPASLFALIAAVFAGGGVIVALSSSAVPVIIGFVIMGIGAGLIEATAALLILGSATEALRPRAIGLLLSAVFMGQFLNPLVVDPLRRAYGIHGAFLAVSITFAFLALMLLSRPVGARLRGSAQTSFC